MDHASNTNDRTMATRNISRPIPTTPEDRTYQQGRTTEGLIRKQMILQGMDGRQNISHRRHPIPTQRAQGISHPPTTTTNSTQVPDPNNFCSISRNPVSRTYRSIQDILAHHSKILVARDEQRRKRHSSKLWTNATSHHTQQILKALSTDEPFDISTWRHNYCAKTGKFKCNRKVIPQN
jgi:hypothetical protein